MVIPSLGVGRGVLAASVAGFGAWSGLGILAQVIPLPPDVSQFTELAKEAGGWVTALIVLWFYRKDYYRLNDSLAVMIKEANEAQKKAAADQLQAAQLIANSQQQVAVAVMANTEALRALASRRRRSDDDYSESGT